MTALLATHTPQHFQDEWGLYTQASLAVLKVLPSEYEHWQNEYDRFVVRARELIFLYELDLEDRQVIQECERALVARLALKYQGKDAGSPPSDHPTNSPHDSNWNDADTTEENSNEQPSRCKIIREENQEDMEWFCPLLWRFAFSGYYSFATHFARRGMLSDRHKSVITEGSLWVGATPDIVEELDVTAFGSWDAAFPLRDLSVSSVEASLAIGNGPNETGYLTSDRNLHDHRRNGRTIWHEFLFKWWRSDPRRDWGRLKFERESILKTLRSPYTIHKPEESTSDRLPDLKNKDSFIAWDITKVLIRKGAALHGTVCLTEGGCSRLLAEEKEPEKYDEDRRAFGMHPLNACWELNVVDVLRALVPNSAFDELRQLITKSVWRLDA